MPIGVVNDADFERELGSYSTSAEIHQLPEKGRGTGKANVPQSIRKIIGTEAVTNGHGAGVALAKELNVSESSVSAYQKGATSTAMMDRPDPDLSNHINEVKHNIASEARKKVSLAIQTITAQKLEDSSPRIAAGVARDLSTVVKNMEPAAEKDGRDNTVFNFFVPKMKGEDAFEVIDVKE